MILISIVRWTMLGCAGYLATLFATDVIRNKEEWKKDSSSPLITFCLGMFVDFCDTLGVGSYALTIAINQALKQIRLDQMLGTLAVGVSGLIMTFETVVSLHFIPVDGVTLVMTTISAIIGAWIGARYGAGFSEKTMYLFLGPLLMVIAIYEIYTLSTLSSSVSIHTAIGLSGYKLILGTLGIGFLGVLQSLGLGMGAPGMALMLLLGVSAKSVYPLVQAASGFAVIFSAVKFIQVKSYQPKASVFLMLGGFLGVAIAVTLVKSLPMEIVNWLVSFVLIGVGIQMIFKGIKIPSIKETKNL